MNPTKLLFLGSSNARGLLFEYGSRETFRLTVDAVIVRMDQGPRPERDQTDGATSGES